MILVCGEALFDIFQDGRHDNGFHLDARAGGSPYNVAVGLARLRRPVGFFGGIASDWLGDALVDSLMGEGVDTGPLRRLDRPGTVSFVALEGDGSARYAFYGTEAADRSIEPADVPDGLDEVRAVHLGSYTAVVSPVAEALDTLLDRLPGRLVAYDPNVRLAVAPDLDLWRTQVVRRVAQADLVKASAEDLAVLYPDDDVEVVARDWLARGPALVVVTDGGEGATAWTPRHKVHCPVAPVQVVDTVGAGDTFQAALLAGLDEMGRLDRAGLETPHPEALSWLLNFANTAAALVAGRRGAALPCRHDLPPLEASA